LITFYSVFCHFEFLLLYHFCRRGFKTTRSYLFLNVTSKQDFFEAKEGSLKGQRGREGQGERDGQVSEKNLSLKMVRKSIRLILDICMFD
jgi:hypothetical protein